MSSLEEADLPQEVVETVQPVLNKHKERGWSSIFIKRPGPSTYDGPRVRLHAISPSGERVNEGFDQDERLADNIDAYLEAQSK